MFHSTSFEIKKWTLYDKLDRARLSFSEKHKLFAKIIWKKLCFNEILFMLKIELQKNWTNVLAHFEIVVY